MRLRTITFLFFLAIASLTAQAQVTHVVQKGETLGEICSHYHISLNTMIRANPDLKPNLIHPGQRLKIPSKKIAQSAKKQTPPPKPPSPPPPPPPPTTHTVQHGDTLSSVAKRYGLSVEKLQKINKLHSNILHTGQRLVIRQSIPPAPSEIRNPKSEIKNQPKFTYITPKIKTIIDSPQHIQHWKNIIVHHSGTPSGNAKIFEYYHRNMRHMENGLAYHFIIGNGTDSGDGEIEVGNRWLKQLKGGHVSDEDLNEISLGICLVGNFNKKRPSPKQIASLIELINYLNSIIPGKHPHVTTHREAQPNHTACPGTHFPFKSIHKIFD